MSESKSKINEMAELFLSSSNMENDVAEAFGLMREHLHKKYTKKIYDAFDVCHQSTRKNPPPEVKLLNAWKPFVPEGSKMRINELVDMLYNVNALKEVRDGMDTALAATSARMKDNDISAAAASNASASKDNPSVHNDGVYDIDENCYQNLRGGEFRMESFAGLLMLCAIMNR